MSRTLLIAIAFGLATALINFAPTRFAALGMMIAPFTVLPIFMSVLGFGTAAGIVSSAVATIAMGLMAGPLPAIAFFALLLAPPLYAGHLAGLSRDDSGEEEWYPLSDILFRLTLSSAAVVVATALISGLSQDDILRMMTELTTQMQTAGGSAPAADPAAVEQAARQFAAVLPIAMPASILLMLVMNLHFGAKLARAFGWMVRPQDHIPTATGLPAIAAGLFGLGLLASFFGGQVGVVGQILVGAFGMAFALVGLATLHTLTLGNPARTIILVLSYLLLLFIAPSIIGMVILGLVETLYGLRARALAGRNP
ncbi:MAG: DUF2232 domain-containing protein [Pseudomonadota bacterium]